MSVTHILTSLGGDGIPGLRQVVGKGSGEVCPVAGTLDRALLTLAEFGLQAPAQAVAGRVLAPCVAGVCLIIASVAAPKPWASGGTCPLLTTAGL